MQELKIKANKEMITNIADSITAMNYMMHLDFYIGFNLLFAIAFDESVTILPGWAENVKMCFLNNNIQNKMNQKYLKTVESINKKMSNLCSQKELKLKITTQEIRVLEKLLDLAIRLSLGQFGELFLFRQYLEKQDEDIKYMPFSDSDDYLQMFKLRNELDVFKELYSSGHSLGIHSKKLSKNIKSIYDFYKVLMYEQSTEGVYSYEPYPLSEYSLPKISFPLEEELREVTSKQELLSFLNKGKRKFYQEKNDIWAPINGIRSIRVDIGDYIARKKNGYFEVIKKEDFPF